MHNPTVNLIFWLPNGTCPANASNCGPVNGTGSNCPGIDSRCTFENPTIDPCLPDQLCRAGRNDSDFEALITSFFHSLGPSDLYFMLSQYRDLLGGPGILRFNPATNVTIATDPLPAGRGTAASPLLLSDLEHEINLTILRMNWFPLVVNGAFDSAYLLFTPYGVYSCDSNYTSTCPSESFRDFCGFHDYFTSAVQTSAIFAVLPDVGTGNCGMGLVGTPNGDPLTDAELNVVTHEVSEAVTDPFLDAWYNTTTGLEVADECAWNFGPPAQDGADVSLGPTFRADVQYIWSNVAGGCYLSPTVTFVARGLPSGALWSVDTGAPPFTYTNTTAGSLGRILTLDDGVNGSGLFTLHFAIEGPPGFGVARITGSVHPSQTAANITRSTTLVVRFGGVEKLSFTESSATQSRLYPGAPWSVSLAPALRYGGPAPETATTNGSTIAFDVPAGAAYRFAVTGPGPEYAVLPAHGRVHVPAHAIGKTVKFKLLTETIAFKESGLASGSSWTVTIMNGSTPALSFPLSGSQLAGMGAVRFRLPIGNYSYAVSSTSTHQTPTPMNGTFAVLSAPSPKQTFLVKF